MSAPVFLGCCWGRILALLISNELSGAYLKGVSQRLEFEHGDVAITQLEMRDEPLRNA
ncbi:MAG: hypothetical protein AAGJ94_05225 [Pseudomonadota bacterium]